MNKKEAQRYRELQERKKRQLDKQRQHARGAASENRNTSNRTRTQGNRRSTSPRKNQDVLDLDLELEKRDREASRKRRDYQDDYEDVAYERPSRRQPRRMPEDIGISAKRGIPKSQAGGKNERQNVSRRQAKKLAKQNGKRKMGLMSKLQGVVSIGFMVALRILHILPWWYMVILGVVLFLLFFFAFRKQTNRARHGVGIIVSTLLIAIMCAGTYYSLLADQALRKIGGDGSDAVTIDVEHQAFNVYLSGIDVYGDVSQNSRSDVNIIATLNPQTHQMLLTTTPRDYYVEIPNVSDGQRDKLTHAGLYGVNASMDTLENLYDIDIEMYARINFSSLIDIIDTMGGITVDSDVEFKTSKASGCVVDIQKGPNTLNGKEALAFSRERHNLKDGDNQRGKNQEAVIKGIMNKIFLPQTLLNSGRIIDCVCKNVVTNMTDTQLRALIRAQLNTLKGWDMQSVAAEGEASREICYSYAGNALYVTLPDDTSVANIRARIEEIMSAVYESKLSFFEELFK